MTAQPFCGAPMMAPADCARSMSRTGGGHDAVHTVQTTPNLNRITRFDQALRLADSRKVIGVGTGVNEGRSMSLFNNPNFVVFHQTAPGDWPRHSGPAIQVCPIKFWTSICIDLSQVQNAL
jgi:hypothetical protein